MKYTFYHKVFGEYIYQRLFFNGGTHMVKRFKIDTVIENGQGHYQIVDQLTGNEIHCDFNELNETIYELLEENK